jgi:hypothetical protein
MDLKNLRADYTTLRTTETDKRRFKLEVVKVGGKWKVKNKLNGKYLYTCDSQQRAFDLLECANNYPFKCRK